MPRTEVYQLRLTKGEKDELGNRAREQGISIAALIRQRLNLDAGAVVLAPRSGKSTSATVEDIRAQMDAGEFERLVAKHKLRHPTATAERMARKELES